MKKELISIIVPIYDVEKYLPKCIDSLLNQTYKNLEIILIDDGSPDNSGKICDNYAKKDKRIKVIHKKNGGLSETRNIGIENSNGTYISFIDSDDYIDNRMIEKLYCNLKETNSDISFCNLYKQYPNKLEKRMNNEQNKVFEENEKYETLGNEYAKIIMTACNKLYKKEIFEEIRYPKGKLMEDSHVILDILKKAKRISYLSEPLYYYVQRENSIMHNFTLKHLEIIDIYESRIKFCIENKLFELMIQIKKTYIYNLILKIIPGLIAINEQEKLKEISNKVKKISKEIRNNKKLTIKEKIKFYILSYCPITYVKITKKVI